MKKQRRPQESAASLRMDYLSAASWYWYRAEGTQEDLTSALQRMEATNLQRRCEAMNIPLPSVHEIREYAIQRWPAHKVHD